ncbi:hypothetical protein PLICRDRAFT_170285 [Plicaturopsis crispa FD-325 SS-3]|nr:hypothetical protein PLICRDRAFT_170285 [Plicaturopsis crispa FD-325 SS-3]
MLSRSRTVAVRRRIQWRGMSTAEPPERELHAGERSWAPRQFSKRNLDEGPRSALRFKEEGRTVCIRPWHGVNSMTEGLAILRGVEKKYGRIREYRFIRDYERPEKYQKFFWADFQDPESFRLVSTEGDNIQVRVPPAKNSELDGGLSLQDIDALLEPQSQNNEKDSADWMDVASKSQVDGSEMQVVDVRIERRAYHFEKNDSEAIEATRNKKLATGHAFCQWGGFAKLEPLTSSPYTSGDGPQSIDKLRMREALSKWSTIVGRQDPSVAVADESPAPNEPPSHSAPSTPRREETHKRPPAEAPVVRSVNEWEPLPDASVEVTSTSEAEAAKRAERERMLQRFQPGFLRLNKESSDPVISSSPTPKPKPSVKTPSPRKEKASTETREKPAKAAAAPSPPPRKASAKPRTERKTERTAPKEKKPQQEPVPSSLKDRLWGLIGGNKWN